MFDIGFTELLLIAVVALIVLGPERLPKAARLAGLWVRRARAQWASVKAELEHEVAAEEIKRNLHDTQAAMRQAQASLRDAGQQAREQVDATADLMRGPAPPPAQATAAGTAPTPGPGRENDENDPSSPSGIRAPAAPGDDDVRR